MSTVRLPRPHPPRTRVRRRPLLAVLLFAACASVTLGFWSGLGAVSIYGYAVFSILGTKLFLSLLPARRWPRLSREELARLRVGVVVTVYNEDPRYLRRCLDSLVEQTLRPCHIVVVDDLSSDVRALEVARGFERQHPGLVTVVRHDQNAGKRHALATGFDLLAGAVDIFLCVDSDTILEPNAIDHGVRPFRDERVTATTGVVLAENHERNVLTRLIDVRYINAFLGERAAYSRLGSVLCVCGSLAFYRASALLPHVRRFLRQRFLGQVVTVGDDRHLTNLCLLSGKVVLAESSIAHTAVPERFSHYLRQQVRWGRSFFRESIWVLLNRRPTAVAWWLTLVELGQWFVFTTLVSFALFVHPFLTGSFIFGQYLAFIGLMATARSVRYFDVRRADQSALSRARSFLVSPLYGYLGIFVMAPLRLWSLLTLRNTAWGTRSTVEVASAPSRSSRPATASDLVLPTARESADATGHQARGAHPRRDRERAVV